MEDFLYCIESNELDHVQFKGSPFTWWNGRTCSDNIFERLDKILVISVFQDHFNVMEVEHLPRIGSDHAPFLFSCDNRDNRFIKPFRFLNFWTKHRGFKEIVRLNWDDEFSANPFLHFKRKIKKVKQSLSSWSKDSFGDIFQQLISREEITRIKEKNFEEFPSPENRAIMQRAQGIIL